MSEFLALVGTFFLVFMACHYFISQVWKNSKGCFAVGVLFAVAYLVFVKVVGI